jgi:hypothetical protein
MARPDPRRAAPTRLGGPRLVVARATWLVVALLSVALFIVGVPLHPPHLHTVCAGVTCGAGTQTQADVARQLHMLGVSVAAYAAFSLAVKLTFASVYFVVGAFLFWRRSDDWMALLVALFLITFPFIYSDVPGVLARDHVAWWWLVGTVAFISNADFPLCL